MREVVGERDTDRNHKYYCSRKYMFFSIVCTGISTISFSDYIPLCSFLW